MQLAVCLMCRDIGGRPEEHGVGDEEVDPAQSPPPPPGRSGPIGRRRLLVGPVGCEMVLCPDLVATVGNVLGELKGLGRFWGWGYGGGRERLSPVESGTEHPAWARH
jgi:hypothetical protein